MLNKSFLSGFVFIFIFSLSGFSQDLKALKKHLDDAEFDIYMEDYEGAINKLMKYTKVDTSNAYINYKIGLCYLSTLNDKAKSLAYLKKAVFDISPNFPDGNYDQRKAPVKAWISLGESYSICYQFDQAIFAYQRFFKLSKSKDKELLNQINRKIESAQNAKKLIQVPIKIEKELVCPDFFTGINNKNAIVSADESMIVYTSEEADAQQIYFSHKKGENKDGKWSKPEDITQTLKSEGDLTSVYLSPDGTTLLVSKLNNKINWLYESKFNGKKWSKAIWLPAIINVKNQTTACMTSDGQTLYFSSDKPGGFGGYDIYKSNKDAKGQWTNPVNLGEKINTPFDEISPQILSDNRTLFFSSQGHTSMGKLDIFYSSMKDNGEWSKPSNMGSPLNTPDDESFYFPIADGFTGYFSMKPESKPGEKNEQNCRLIYKIKIVPLDTNAFAAMRKANPIKAKESTNTIDTITAAGLHGIYMKDTSIYTILVKEARNSEESSYLRDLEGIKVYNKDERYRYYFGLYYNMDTAKNDLSRFQQLGFNNASIKNAEKDGFFASSIPASKYNQALKESKTLAENKATELKEKEVQKEENTEVKKQENTENKKENKKQKKEIVQEEKTVKNKKTEIDESASADEVKVPIYTIQVCATHNPSSDYKFFKDLKKVRQNTCSDGWFRYTSGDFDDLESARQELVRVKASGFAGAYVISYKDYRAKFMNGKATTANVKMLNIKNTVFEIQLFSSTTQVTEMRRFGTNKNIKEYLCKDGRYRYTTGSFNGYQAAKNELAKIIEQGMDGAFIVGMQNFESKYFDGDMQSKTNSIENKTANIRWAIQIVLTKKKKILESFNLTGVQEKKVKEGYKYFYGDFKTYKEAKAELENIKNGDYPSAFIIAK